MYEPPKTVMALPEACEAPMTTHSQLAQRVTLRLLPGQDLEPEFISTLRPRNARLMMGVAAR